MVLKGHSNAILEVAWTYDERGVVSASADKTVFLWDVETGQRARKQTHASFVNACATVRRGTPLYATGSDDKSTRVRAIHCKLVDLFSCGTQDRKDLYTLLTVVTL
jgi:Prp8 binding protein